MKQTQLYITYEEPLAGRTFTKAQMKEVYHDMVNKEEYAIFEDWLFDMLKSGVFEEMVVYKHEDYYSVSYKNADCSLSGTLEEVKEDIKNNFGIEVEIQF